eukprot:TRINITY_DN9076_c0_g1_i1.p1 TRINITY_DN9076_c0_g1~~TRINITY_DN9076_c0_g1_i1.p1  ORF type:complete len:684 (+),score=116.08 TRINITY_DN9076_c0_g1_i1:45-2054(+)
MESDHHLLEELRIALHKEFQHLSSSLCREVREELSRNILGAHFAPAGTSRTDTGVEPPASSRSVPILRYQKTVPKAPTWTLRHIRRQHKEEDEDEGDELMLPAFGKVLTDFLFGRSSSFTSSVHASEVGMKPEHKESSIAAVVPCPSLSELNEMPNAVPMELEHSQAVVQSNSDLLPVTAPASSERAGMMQTSSSGRKPSMFRPSVKKEAHIDRALGAVKKRYSYNPAAQTRPGCSCVSAVAKGIVKSLAFEQLVMLLIVANCASIGWQTDIMAKSLATRTPFVFRVCNLVFCILFSLEITLRLLAYKLRFFYMSGFGWNLLDMCLLIVQIADEVVEAGGEGPTATETQLSALRFARMLRAVRVVRAVRLIGFTEDLRILLASVIHSAKAILWSLAFTGILVYVYAIYLTKRVTVYRLEAQDLQGVVPIELDQTLTRLFGTVLRSCLTLFQGLTGGMDWGDFVSPLSESVGDVWVVATVFWVGFMILGVLNVITASFVENSIARSKVVKENDVLHKARVLFRALDLDNSGEISYQEIQEHLEEPGVQEFFRSIDVDPSEAESLFGILDISGDGSLNFEEFIGGCIRLQDNARALDLLMVTVDSHMAFDQSMAELGRIAEKLDMFLSTTRTADQILSSQPVTSGCLESFREEDSLGHVLSSSDISRRRLD